jgi:hypothetical protein
MGSLASRPRETPPATVSWRTTPPPSPRTPTRRVRPRAPMDPPAPRARARRWTGAVIAEAVGLSRDGGPDAGPARPGAPAGRGGPARGPALRVGTAGSLLHVDIKKLGRIAGIGHRITGDRRQRVRHGRGLSAPRRRLVRLLSEWAYAVAYPSSPHHRAGPLAALLQLASGPQCSQPSTRHQQSRRSG